MTKDIIIYTSLIFVWLIITTVVTKEDHKLWASIESPKMDYQILLYLKERKLLQVPEILIYYKSKSSTFKKAVGNILLPEDDSNTLSYQYEWENNHKLTLTLNCDLCMIHERNYKIEFKNNKKITQIKNNYNKPLVFSEIQSF